MLDARTKTTLLQTLPKVYEVNYGRLSHLIPNLRERHGTFSVPLDDITHLSVEILEQHQYTTLLSLIQQPTRHSVWVPELHMKIRIYHDARCAEVISYQHCGRFRASYPYPNRDMYQPLEKRQVNLFFHDWLHHCLLLRRQYQYRLSPTQV